MAPPFARYAQSAGGVAVFSLFVACGGVTDPGLFGATGTAGGSNHAGASSDGGAPAHGGSAAQGGVPSSAGSGAAGERSSAGVANGGGSAAGSGGAAQAGAGNSAGTTTGGSPNGGAANGGSAGSTANAGTGGGDGETCQTLFAKANKELTAAQVCNIAADATQCTGTVKNPCNCEVPVNRENSAETSAYQATRDELDKRKCVQLCPAIACLPAHYSVCRAAILGGAAGTCVASYAQPL
jgi:hypothetical protein